MKNEAIKNFFVNVEKSLDFAIIGPAVQEKKDQLDHSKKNENNLIEVEYVKGFAMFLNLTIKRLVFLMKTFYIFRRNRPL